VAIEYRWAEGQYDRLPALAADLVGRKVDVIAAFTTPSALAAKEATSTIPIVFSVGDPIEAGHVGSLARPSGNLTGVSVLSVELMAKRLELLSELVPQARVIALLVNPNYSITEQIIRDVQKATRTKGVQLPIVKAGTESEIDAAFASLVELHAGALLVGGDPLFANRRNQLVALAARNAVPAMYYWRSLPRLAAWPAMDRATRLPFGKLAFTSERSSEVPSRPICRSSNRRGLSLSSTSTLRRRSG
jgi:putative ABC transport system substrate-binding protein